MVVHDSKCRACEAPLLWTVTTKGKKMPVDAKPTEFGPFVLLYEGQRQPTAKYIGAAGDSGGEKRYESHWATCTDAEKFRRTPAQNAKVDAARAKDPVQDRLPF